MSELVDEALVCLKGGDGGAGAVSFRREAHVARGGPDGGDGGTGGDVWLVADPHVASLLAFQDHPHRRAANGAHGMGKGRHGGAGEDLRVPVPVGTVVTERGGGPAADLAAPGDAWLAARGGRGGRGNARFLSNRRRAPSFAEQGEVGEPLGADGGDADEVLAQFAQAGIDEGELAARLQNEGAETFVKSWRDLLGSIGSEAERLAAAH
jgi:GTP-binding protein